MVMRGHKTKWIIVLIRGLLEGTKTAWIRGSLGFFRVITVIRFIKAVRFEL
jgi:hypothetical protein